MAPNLAPSKHKLIYDMIHSGELSITEMALAAGCNKSTISRISSNIRMFGSVRAPPINGGRPRSITPDMLEALCDYLIEKPTLYLDEMAIFLWDEFALRATKSSISRALKSKGSCEPICFDLRRLQSKVVIANCFFKQLPPFLPSFVPFFQVEVGWRGKVG